MSELPKFDSPPVVETVIGVSFDPIPGWDIPHLGLFWNQVRTDFPEFKVQPTLPDTPEEQFPAKTPGKVNIEITSRLAARCWFVSAEGNTLIQVQNNRFCYNWRKTGENQSYPHYDDSIRPSFVSEWNRFAMFVKDEFRISAPPIRQCEITYVNHIEMGSNSKMHELFSGWSGQTTTDFLPEPDRVGVNASYEISDQGR